MELSQEQKFKFRLRLEQEQEQEAQASQQGSKPGVLDTMGALSDMSPWNQARKYTTELGGEKIAEGLSYAGARVGFPKTGQALGVGLGLATQMAPDILATMAPAETEAAVLRSPAENFGRRALGYNKGLIKRAGGVEKANKVAGQMLDEGVITPFSSPATMLERAKDISASSGKRIGETLESINQPATTTMALKSKVSSQLMPTRQGGQYDKERGIVSEIVDTISAHGPGRGKGFTMEGPVSFESAQELKQTIGGPAKFGKLTDGERSEMFRRAYGIVREKIDTSLGDLANSGLIPKEKVAQFLKDKAIYGASQQAIETLKDKLAGDAANNIISLRGTMGAMAGIATGDIGKTFAGLGIWEAGRRISDPLAASTLNYLSKQRGVNLFRTSVISEYVDRDRKRQ